MPTINVLGLAQQHPRHVGALGNEVAEHYKVSADSAGKVNGVDLGSGDVIRLGVLPGGWKLLPADVTVTISDAFGTGVTGTLGFAYTDGVDSSAVPQDADYFMTSNSLAAQAIVRGNNAAVVPVVLPKDAYLILTTGGTAHDASAARLDAVVRAINVGL